MGLCFALFGVIRYMHTPWLIMIYSLTLRLLKGACSAFIQTTCYSVVINDYPDKKEAMIGYLEASTGVGLILGPLAGSTLYALYGFENTFLIFGSMIVFLSILIAINFPENHFP